MSPDGQVDLFVGSNNIHHLQERPESLSGMVQKVLIMNDGIKIIFEIATVEIFDIGDVPIEVGIIIQVICNVLPVFIYQAIFFRPVNFINFSIKEAKIMKSYLCSRWLIKPRSAY